jgi:hypothetical protein
MATLQHRELNPVDACRTRTLGGTECQAKRLDEQP